MTTVTLKRYFWKDFEKTQTWKYTFLVLDTIMCIVTYPVFFPFVILFQDHKAETKLRFYGPMVMLLGFVLTFASMVMYRHHLSWFTIVWIFSWRLFLLFVLVIQCGLMIIVRKWAIRGDLVKNFSRLAGAVYQSRFFIPTGRKSEFYYIYFIEIIKNLADELRTI